MLSAGRGRPICGHRRMIPNRGNRRGRLALDLRILLKLRIRRRTSGSLADSFSQKRGDVVVLVAEHVHQDQFPESLAGSIHVSRTMVGQGLLENAVYRLK